MNWNQLIRQTHRYMSVAFTLAALANIIAVMTRAEPNMWVGFLALGPLILLLITGLYLFVLPYVSKTPAAKPG